MKFNESLTGADYADFYSLANLTLWQVYNSYNPDIGISFDLFFRACLKKKFISELMRRHRQKRILNQFADSLDAVSGDEEECSLAEFIPSDFDTFEEAVRGQESGQYRDKVQQYISRLSNRQKNILNLLMEGYKPKEIRKILDISANEYSDSIQIMRSYENIKVLF